MQLEYGSTIIEWDPFPSPYLREARWTTIAVIPGQIERGVTIYNFLHSNGIESDIYGSIFYQVDVSPVLAQQAIILLKTDDAFQEDIASGKLCLKVLDQDS